MIIFYGANAVAGGGGGSATWGGIGGSIGDQSDLAALFAGKADKTQTIINDNTASRTGVVGDAGARVRFTAGLAASYVINTVLNSGAPIGFRLVIANASAGSVTVSSTDGLVTLLAPNGLSLVTANSVGTLEKVASNLWSFVSYDTAGQIANRRTFKADPINYAATITPARTANDMLLTVGTLTGNLTIGAPTGTFVHGDTITWELQLDGTAGRTITWDAVFAFGAQAPQATIPTTANAKIVVLTKWNANDSKHRVMAIATF